MKIKAICLCLPQREEYWRQLQSQVEALGVEFKPFIVGTDIQDKTFEEALPVLREWDYGQPEHKLNHYNAFLCHRKMIEWARTEGLDYVWILEDDCYLLRRFTELGKLLWNKIDEWLFTNLPALLYLGYWWEEDWYPQLEKIFKEHHNFQPIKVHGNIGGLHSVLVHKNMFDNLILLPANNPWDRQLNLLGHSNLHSYMMNVKLCHIRTCYSFCEGSVIERKELE